MFSTRGGSEAADLVLTFLDSVGRRSDSELYLRLFRELPKESFALVAPESAALRDATASFVEQLRFLRELGLVAPLATGVFGPQAPAALLERVRKTLAGAGLAAERYDAADPAAASQIRGALLADVIPLLDFGASGSGESDRYAALARLGALLGTRKVVIVRRSGALRLSRAAARRLGRWQTLSTPEGALSVVNLQTDLPLLEPKGTLAPATDLALLKGVAEVLHAPGCERMSASVTAPLDLLAELFTVRGAGTLIKRGATIQRHSGYATVDLERLRHLLEESFGRRLSTTFFDQPPAAVYLEQSYQGAAIVQARPQGSFLSKFAVSRLAQGEGIGRDLWQAMAQEHPKLYWRSRPDNPIAAWYASLCDGLFRQERWTVYFIGMSPSELATVIESATSQPEDFEPREAS